MVQWHSALRNNGGLQLRDSSRFSRDSLLASPFLARNPDALLFQCTAALSFGQFVPFDIAMQKYIKVLIAQIPDAISCTSVLVQRELKSVFLRMILSASYRRIKQSILR